MKPIIQTGLLIAWFCVSGVYAQPSLPKGGDDPRFTITLGVSGIRNTGPAQDAAAEMRFHGFGHYSPSRSGFCLPFYGCGSTPYPKVTSGSFGVGFGIDFRVFGGVRISGYYAQFDHGSVIGRRANGDLWNLAFSLKSFEPSIVVTLPRKRKFPLDLGIGLGPGFYRATVESQNHLSQKETRVGVVVEAVARTAPQKRVVFVEFRASYRFVGEASYGPYTGGHAATGNGWTFPESKASFDTLSISIGLGFRFGRGPGAVL